MNDEDEIGCFYTVVGWISMTLTGIFAIIGLAVVIAEVFL